MIRYALALALIAGPAAALELTLPVDCEMGARCYIQSFVDRDPGPGYADFTCGSLSYDGHKGTDFRVATFAEMEAGVTVVAAAAGRVRAVRDGVADLGAKTFPTGKDCGNAAVITHPDGWETQYCHLRNGSILVRSGDQVAQGQPIGLMGFSGRTEFPHLHLSIRRDGAPVDPFGAQAMAEGCAAPEVDSLWSEKAQRSLTFRPGGVVSGGMSDTRPALDALRMAAPDRPDSRRAETLFVWGRFFGVRKGDEILLRLTGPEGEVVSDRVTLDRHRAEEMRFAGRRAKGPWPQGVYRTTVTLIRNGRQYETLQDAYTLN